MTAARPFLKWAGGKRALVPVLRPYVDGGAGVYREPFVGGGALFFALRPQWAVLSDANPRLVAAYRGVRDHVESVIATLAWLTASECGSETYYRMRSIDIDRADDTDTAAWLIYLNRTGYNGLYRVNRRGQYNVPWGKRPFRFDPDVLRAASATLAGVSVRHEDFEPAIDHAKPGDVVYADPPYLGTFTAYTGADFTGADQLRLRNALLRAKRRGVRVVASNSAAAVPLYAGADFTVQYVDAPRRIAANGGRADAREIIIT